MSLRKTDKIIAVLGVIILVCAGVGIYYYQSGEGDEEINGEPQETTYMVTWEQMSDSFEVKGSVDKTAYTKPIIIEGLEEGCVLTTVSVNLTWSDDKTMGKLFNKGEDTLTVKIGLPGQDSKPVKSTGGAKGKDIGTFIINDRPLDEEIIDVEDEAAVDALILGEYMGMNTATLDVKVTWEKGESILTIRPLKLLNFFLDKGNNFKLMVSYQYYKYTIKEPEDFLMDDFEPEDNDYEPTTYSYFPSGQIRC